MIKEDIRSLRLPVILVRQPIGEFYVGVMKSRDLVAIADFDVRRIQQGEGIESYLGIQRELSTNRVKEIRQYVQGSDATFPTAVVIAVNEKCASLQQACEESESHFWITLTNHMSENPDDQVLYREIARVIDGQHRIEGLREYKKDDFDVNVAIFVGADVPDQAMIFSTVNLAQTKVNKSLVYDLFEIAKSPSPERLAHKVVVGLNRSENSPFKGRIKRLGTATEGREGETLAQATVVAPILEYMSGNKLQVLKDRQAGRKGREFEGLSEQIPSKLVLRPFLLEDRADDLALLIWNYFDAVSEKWPNAWDGEIPQGILNRTNGYNGLMRFFRPVYKSLARPGAAVSLEEFKTVFDRVELPEASLNSKVFVPGTSGATDLFKTLMEQTGLEA